MNNTSLYRIIHYHLAHALRKSKTLGWLKLSVTYLQMLVLRWDESMLEARRLAYMTPQVCYLEKYLQIKFGDNSIRVVDPTVDLYAFTSAEHDEATLEELYMLCPVTFFYSSYEINVSKFVVQVSRLTHDQYGESIEATIRKFRLPGFVFILQVII